MITPNRKVNRALNLNPTFHEKPPKRKLEKFGKLHPRLINPDFIVFLQNQDISFNSSYSAQLWVPETCSISIISGCQLVKTFIQDVLGVTISYIGLDHRLYVLAVTAGSPTIVCNVTLAFLVDARKYSKKPLDAIGCVC
uniref:G_PROTEIN_RECEP_F1_2 domain-containing protein n=1 Tax=Caenorhabditis tropicalis TaxID=1561998 RepID=A0A1I7TIL9_9PELO